jgi:hypothetical protein
MADRSTRLTIRVLLDAANAAGGLRQLGDQSDGIGDKFKKIAAAGAAFAGVTAFVKGAAEAASKLQQSTGGVEAVFKSSAGQVKAWGQQAASTIGLSTSAYQDLATLIGAQLKNAGTAMEDLGPKTNTLINQGADLAAMFGGTTAEAVQAMSSALKGERDPIEKYGVSLTQASIDAEIMAEGLDTSTSAAKQAATATATLALITKQTADAQGAAAREADSYASVQQRVSAVWENTMAQIGTALLPALSSLMDGFAKIAPVIGDVVTPIAELLGWVLQLPGPILAVVASIAAWSIFGGSVTKAVGSFATTVRTATSSMSGFKSAISGVASSLAGGLALAGVSLLIMAITQEFQRSSEAARTGTEAYKGVVDALVANSGAWSDAAAEAQRSAILQSDAFKGLTSEGFSAAAAIDILLGTQENWIDIQSNNSDATRNLTKDTAAAVNGMIDANGAAQHLADAQLEGAAALAAKTGATAADTAATGLNAAEQQKLAEAQNEAALKAAEQAAANTTVKASLDAVKAAASQASTEIEFYVLQMNLANGISVNADQAAKLLNDSMRGLGDAFKGAAEKGGINTDALAAWNVAALTSTEAGSSLYDALTKSQTAYATSTVTAYQNAAANGDTAAGMTAAASAADVAYQAFITTASAAGLTGDQAAALAAKLGIVQGTQIDAKTFQLIADNAQADKAVSDLQAAQIANKTVEVNANVAPATGAIDAAAGASYETTVTADANTSAATSQINSVTDATHKTVVDTSANVAPATSQVNAFTGAARDTTVQVQANTTAAQQAITALVTQQRTLTITVNANTGPAESSIRSVTNGSYSATINVSANTSAAQSAIAAIPRSVSVAPPPAPAAPAGFSAMSVSGFGAPDVAGFAAPVVPWHAPAPGLQTVPQSQSVTYTINLRGGITDPDGAARAIEKVLRDRSRRSTTVYAR